MALRLVPSIHRATHRIGLYLAHLREDGLSRGEAHILAQLATSAPATIADLHRGLAHKRSTLTSILDRLAARGLITREPGTDDRRTFVIGLTAKGKATAVRVHRHLTTLEEAVACRVTATDVRGFLKVLATVEEQAHAETREARSRRRAGLERAPGTPTATRRTAR
jgi:DNA-binding MarR family transcriptional regulator